MKNLTIKELMLLGKDLSTAKILVLYKHGFSCAEIACVMGIAESVIRRTIDSAETNLS